MSVSVRSTQSIVDSIVLREADIGIVSMTYPLKDVEVLHEHSMRAVCLLPESHPAAQTSGEISLTELTNEPFITLERPLFEQLGLTAELNRTILKNAWITSHSAPAITAMAHATGRVAIIDNLTAMSIPPEGGMVVRPLVENIIFSLAVIVKNRANCSIAAQLVIDEIVMTLEQPLRAPSLMRFMKELSISKK